VYKKFSKNVFIGIPLTTTVKESKFYYTFDFKERKSTAILSQIRLFDSKRLAYSIGRMSQGDYSVLKQKLIALLQ
jgi:mRNA interferase MazF